MLSYSKRSELCSNPTAKKLLALMDSKKTNLALSLDVCGQKDLLQLAEIVGPEICVLKTHIDILNDFEPSLITKLTALAKKHNFILFEDRKFADIGNTVKLQYAQGIYKIAQWATITNAHVVPGPGVIQGLKEVGLPLGNALLLLAEMSSKDHLFSAEYQQAAVKMALEHKDFVIGFITQHRLLEDPRFIHFTPGVHLAHPGDNLGQQYTSPKQAIVDKGVDVIIVGRGIYEHSDPQLAARSYREAGWEAYLERTANHTLL
jgi:orotidine 5'-phosphate decarboxylase subfamily 1